MSGDPRPPAYYPVYLSLVERLVVVKGGGSVAERKVAGLLRCGARVRVVASELTRELEERALGGEIEHVARPYRPGDLEGAALALAEPGEPASDRAFFAEADRGGAVPPALRPGLPDDRLRAMYPSIATR